MQLTLPEGCWITFFTLLITLLLNRYNDRLLPPGQALFPFSKQINYIYEPQNVLLYFQTESVLLHFNQCLVIYTVSTCQYSRNLKSTTFGKKVAQLHTFQSIITNPMCIQKQLTRVILRPIANTEGLCKQMTLVILYHGSSTLTTLLIFKMPLYMSLIRLFCLFYTP